LLEAEHETVFVVEGEKDADNLAALGFTATTNIGSWRCIGKASFAVPTSHQSHSSSTR
jgi:5S rRNA maturation endonuclease (ribonuclease M5)